MKKSFILFIIAIVVVAITIPSQSSTVVDMRLEKSGIYTLPCEVNGLKLRFIFDTGATNVSMSLTEASFMLKNGYMEFDDFTGVSQSQIANGEIMENYNVTLRKLVIGGVELENVQAEIVKGLDAPLLLGQSVLNRLGNWTIRDNKLYIDDTDNGTNYEIVDSVESYEYVVVDSVCREGYETWQELEEDLRVENNSFAESSLIDYIYHTDLDTRLYACRLYPRHRVSIYYKGESTNIYTDTILKRCFSILSGFNGVDVRQIMLNYSTIFRYEPDFDKAIKYLEKIEKRHPDSIAPQSYDTWAHTILENYWYGTRKGSLNPLKTASFGERCYTKGYFKAYTLYGDILSYEFKKDQEAVSVYKKAANRGCLDAKFKLANCYMDGTGIAKSATMAVKYFNEGTNAGHFESIREACRRYYFGDGIAPNYNKVIEYANKFPKEDEVGNINIIKKAYLGIAYFKLNRFDSVTQYLEDIDVQHALGDSHLMTAYNDGLIDLESEVLFVLGQIYENGQSVEVNLEKAYEYYEKLCNIDKPWGYSMLGDLYVMNEFIEKDFETGFKYYLLAAKNGSAYGACLTATCYYFGIGTTKNEHLANIYKAKAIESGQYTKADFNF